MAGSLFRFPGAVIGVANTTDVIAIKTAAGKNYRMTLETLMTLVESAALPSISDDGTDVVIDADVEFTGNIKAAGLPTADPEDGESLWLDTGVVTIASAP